MVEIAHDLTERLTALDRAHDLVRPLSAGQGAAALLGDLLSIVLAPYDDLGASRGAYGSRSNAWASARHRQLGSRTLS
ncbi:HWE histidine kinase domain-containing protein [Sphingomonas faeni]|uniref:HWE histidine kinase domain-containing protein n=1 Tax=Sphingomonas faeni TaxID=185950 RepID=UPI0027D807A5|nr:HWE histidine kinase domain-containing protein [Sphingomonas faeni]